MALISCPDCGKDVSNRAVSCPNCGCPIAGVIDDKFIGFPSEVIPEVGTVEFMDGRDVTVQIIIKNEKQDISFGEDFVSLFDPLALPSHLLGSAFLRKKAPRSYKCPVSIRGKVRRCNGVDKIDLADAEIVSDGLM